MTARPPVCTQMYSKALVKLGTYGGSAGLSARTQCTAVSPGYWSSAGAAQPTMCGGASFYCPGYGSTAPTVVSMGHISTPLSVPALRTQVGMNPFCQKQSLVSGESIFPFLQPAYELQVLGARSLKKTPRYHALLTSASSRGGSRSPCTYRWCVASCLRALNSLGFPF